MRDKTTKPEDEAGDEGARSFGHFLQQIDDGSFHGDDRHLCARHGVRQQAMTRVEASIAIDDTIDFCPAHAEIARAAGGTP